MGTKEVLIELFGEDMERRLEGYAIVPIEPTEAMVEAGLNRPKGLTDWGDAVRACWAAMIEAADSENGA
jgi:hypothetical protein